MDTSRHKGQGYVATPCQLQLHFDAAAQNRCSTKQRFSVGRNKSPLIDSCDLDPSPALPARLLAVLFCLGACSGLVSGAPMKGYLGPPSNVSKCGGVAQPCGHVAFIRSAPGLRGKIAGQHGGVSESRSSRSVNKVQPLCQHQRCDGNTSRRAVLPVEWGSRGAVPCANKSCVHTPRLKLKAQLLRRVHTDTRREQLRRMRG